MSQKEIGARPVSEVVYFNVTDAGRNKLPMQMFSISITPVNNQPPVAKVGPGVEVTASAATHCVDGCIGGRQVSIVFM